MSDGYFMSKLGFVTVCHPDYDCVSAVSCADMLVRSLRRQGQEILYIETLVQDFSQGVDAGRELVRSEVDGVIIMLGTWVECNIVMAVVREVEHLPLCIYAYPVYTQNNIEKSTGSYVSYVMFKGSLERAGYKYKGILGLPDDMAVIDSLVSFCKASTAMKSLRRYRIGLVGYSSMSIYPGTFDHLLMRTRIGPDVEHIDSYTLISIAESIDDSACGPVLQELSGKAEIHDDVSNSDILKCAKLYLALKQLVDEKGLQAINVKCQYEFSKQYKMVMCVPLSLLAETGTVSSCEGDMLITVTMAMLNLLSGETVTYGDFLGNNGAVIRLSTCGFAPYSLGVEGTCKIRKFKPHPGFNGLQNSFVLKPGQVTVMRLIEDIGTYHILYTIGNGLKSQLREGYMPNLDVEIGGDIDRFIQNCSGQHFAVCYGDFSMGIEDMARMLGISTIRI
jgi:L-fucose isomerase-like protein